MKILVTGGTGVIGRRAVPALVAAGHDVVAATRSAERDALVRQLGATPTRVDLFDPASVDAAVVGVDAVVNLATHIPPMTRAARASAWDENDRIRTEGVENLVQAARRHDVGRFVQESITFPYADGGNGWIDEDHPRPDSPFTAPVARAEALVADPAVGLPADRVGVVLRFAQFYAADSSHVRTFASLYRRRLPALPGDGAAYTSVLGMEAAARAVVAALAAPAGIYNIADADPPTRDEAGRAVAVRLGVRPPRRLPTRWLARVNPSAEVLMRSHRISTERFRDATGWVSDHAGAEGLARAVAAARAAQ